MTVERLRAEHLPAAAELERDCFSCPATEEQLSRMLADKSCVLLCVTEGETLLGTADFRYVLDEGYIGNIAVREDRRRSGIGTALVEAMLREAWALELAFLTLEVRKSNLPARKLYEKCGFSVVGERRNYYERPREDAVLMTAYPGKEE